MLISNGVSFEFTLCVALLICHRLPYSRICMRTMRAANKIDLLLRFVAGIQLLLTNNFFYYKISQLCGNWQWFGFYATPYMCSCVCVCASVDEEIMFETSCNKIKTYHNMRKALLSVSDWNNLILLVRSPPISLEHSDWRDTCTYKNA